MSTDYRALCAELAAILAEEYGCTNEYKSGRPLDISEVSGLLTRARTALAQPEPVGPTDEDLLACHAKAFNAEMTASMNDYDIEEAGGLSRRIDRCSLAAARAVLACWGRPASTT
jgi:hypothetical protein